MDGKEDEARNFLHLHFFLTDSPVTTFGLKCCSLAVPYVVVTAGPHLLIRNSWGQLCFGIQNFSYNVYDVTRGAAH
jgi:hypothetical protein